MLSQKYTANDRQGKFMFNTQIRKIILATLLVGGLSGCAAGLVGGATAVSSVADRRTAGSQFDDQALELKIKAKAEARLRQITTTAVKPTLSIVSYNHRVLLLGVVGTEAERQAAEEIARAEVGVQNVYNHISVVSSSRTYTNIGADTVVTARVRASLLNTDGVYPGHVKVVTYNGITYVMGLLTPTQQEIVNQRISTTAGVQRVVTLYENYADTSQ